MQKVYSKKNRPTLDDLDKDPKAIEFLNQELAEKLSKEIYAVTLDDGTMWINYPDGTKELAYDGQKFVGKMSYVND